MVIRNLFDRESRRLWHHPHRANSRHFEDSDEGRGHGDLAQGRVAEGLRRRLASHLLMLRQAVETLTLRSDSKSVVFKSLPHESCVGMPISAVVPPLLPPYCDSDRLGRSTLLLPR